MNSCKQHVCDNKRKSLRRSITDELALKEPSHKRLVILAYGGRVILVSKNTPPAYFFSGGNHYSSLRAMTDGDSLGENTYLSFCRFSRLTGSSPTVSHWYQAETGYDITHFSIRVGSQDCHLSGIGHVSSSWTPVQNNLGKPLIQVKFSISDCRACSSQTFCTGTTRRSISLQPREQMQALFAARKREGTDAFKD